jgi:integrase
MIRTKSGLPKHCSWNLDRHGKRRVRFRKGGFSTYLTGTPWSEAFMRQYAAALDGVSVLATNIGISRTKPGSVNALCVSYYRSPEFRGLRPSTQAQRRQIIERFRAEHGEKPIARLGRVHIQEIIGAKADTPEAANNLLKVLRVLLGYAVSLDMIPSNPAAGVKRYRSRGEGFHTWTEAEVAQFEARHPIGTRARLALELMLSTGQRRGDVVRMGWQHVRGDAIAVHQEKTEISLVIPMAPELVQVLASVPKTNLAPELVQVLASVPKTNLTFLVTDAGAAFTSKGFGNWFRQQCNIAGLPQCSAHGLRKLAATRLANAGCTVEQIKAITGHKSLAEVARYTRAADQRRLARQAMDTLRADRERVCPTYPTRLDKTGGK